MPDGGEMPLGETPVGETPGGGCHGGRETMLDAARQAGRSATLDRLLADYKRGPHDQPQSMCPAFGSLRSSLRMRRVATILCGSACCVYGLSFTSRFYGARRSVHYVPFNSESLVRGQVFEDISEAVRAIADPAALDAVVVINLCVPTASGVPLELLPKTVDGVRVIGIDVPGFGVPTHAEAKDVLASAMLRFARSEIETGPVARPHANTVEDGQRTVALIGELFPVDPLTVGNLLAPLGAAVAPPVPAREWRDLYGALDCDVAAAVHPFYVASIREFGLAGRPVVASAPVGVAATEAWLGRVAGALGLSPARLDAALDAALPPLRAALDANRISARITLSGYEGSELLVGRLLVEAGADLPYVGTALPQSDWNDADRIWLEQRGVHVQFRASLEQDLAALDAVCPDLAIGTTPVVQKAKERGTPAIYYTNMVSGRPLLGLPGIPSVAAIVAAQANGRERFRRMVSFFSPGAR